MCKVLNLWFHIVAKHNHKAVGVKFFCKFLNNTVATADEEHDTVVVFAECAIVTTYVWNCSPIDGMDVVYSLPAIGFKLHFLLDIVLSDKLTSC